MVRLGGCLRKRPSIDINQIHYLNLLIPLIKKGKVRGQCFELFWSCLASPLLFFPHQDFNFTRLAIDINQILHLNLLIPLTEKGNHTADAWTILVMLSQSPAILAPPRFWFHPPRNWNQPNPLPEFVDPLNTKGYQQVRCLNYVGHT